MKKNVRKQRKNKHIIFLCIVAVLTVFMAGCGSEAEVYVQSSPASTLELSVSVSDTPDLEGYIKPFSTDCIV